MKFYGNIILLLIISFSLVSVCYSQNPCIFVGSDKCFQTGSGSEYLMSTPGNVDFEFSDMQKYITGITYSGSTQLRLKIVEQNATCKWRLMMYVDNNLHFPDNEWEPLVCYGSSGVPPQLNLIQVRVYNGCRTPLFDGAIQTFAGNVNYDIIEIIPAQLVIIPPTCTGTQVNGPGSYLTDYNEYSFTVDYRIKPGYSLRPGAYQIVIRFCLEEVP